MIYLLDYAPPTGLRHSKWLGRFATLSLFFPLLVAASLYGEWLLAWWALYELLRWDPGFVVSWWLD